MHPNVLSYVVVTITGIAVTVFVRRQAAHLVLWDHTRSFPSELEEYEGLEWGRGWDTS
jgi:hypothetical protein